MNSFTVTIEALLRYYLVTMCLHHWYTIVTGHGYRSVCWIVDREEKTIKCNCWNRISSVRVKYMQILSACIQIQIICYLITKIPSTCSLHKEINHSPPVCSSQQEVYSHHCVCPDETVGLVTTETDKAVATAVSFIVSRLQLSFDNHSQKRFI